MKKLGIALGAIAGVVVAVFVAVGLEMLFFEDDEAYGHAHDPFRG